MPNPPNGGGYYWYGGPFYFNGYYSSGYPLYWGNYYSGYCGTYYGYPGYFGSMGACGYPDFYRYYWMAAPWAFPPLFADPGYAVWSDEAGGYAPAYYSDPEVGSLKFKVTPKGAEVWVDGYYEGTVDKRLKVRGGSHRIEIKALGYETLTVELRVMPGKTVTYTGDLKTLPR